MTIWVLLTLQIAFPEAITPQFPVASPDISCGAAHFATITGKMGSKSIDLDETCTLCSWLLQACTIMTFAHLLSLEAFVACRYFEPVTHLTKPHVKNVYDRFIDNTRSTLSTCDRQIYRSSLLICNIGNTKRQG